VPRLDFGLYIFFLVFRTTPGIGHTYRTPAPLTLILNTLFAHFLFPREERCVEKNIDDRYLYTGLFLSVTQHRHLISRLLSNCVSINHQSRPQAIRIVSHLLSNAIFFASAFLIFPLLCLSTFCYGGNCTKGRWRLYQPFVCYLHAASHQSP